MTYQIIITEEVANVAVTSESYPIIIEYNATSIAANTIYGNTEVQTYLASGTNTGNIITTANISGAYILGNGSALTGIASTYGNANVAANLAAFGSNPVSTSGNVTAGYIAGNGSLLTNITGGNVTGTVANATYALNSNAATFATQATFATTANSVAGANVSGTVANATYALNANASTFAGTVTTAAQPNITSLGIQTAINTSGNVSATGNITGSYFLGNGSQLTGLPATYGNANVAANLAAFANNPISTSGNITAGFFLGDGSQLTNLPAGTYGNANVANFLGNGFGSNTISTTGNVTAAYMIGNGSALTNLTGANVIGTVANATYALTSNAATYASVATFADTANSVAGANVTGTVANATYATSAGSATTAATVTDAAQANITSVGTLTSLSVSGNITGGNVQSLGTVTAAGNLMSIQQTVVGTANVGTTGNIIISGKNIATDMKFNPDGGDAVNGALSRIVVGTGWISNIANVSATGNITHDTRQGRLMVQDTFARGSTSTSVQLFASDPIVSLTGNVTNNSFRVQGIGARVRVGGGSMGNTIQITSAGAGTVGAVAAMQPNIDVGNVSPYFLGNTTISHATLNGGFITTQSGGFVGNAYGMIPGVLASTLGNADATGNITNYIGSASNLQASPYITGNLYAFYHPNVISSSQQSATALGVAAAARRATNYYAFRNDDPFAQVQLGSLRTFHEYQHTTGTSGTVAIDKNNGQVQYIAPTANVTIGDFQNFVFNAVSSASNVSLANIAQVDTVTLVIQQGATPYTVTMPTGNAAIKYAAGNSTVSTTANSATMISITGTKVGNATTSGTGLYLVTVSPEFV